MQAMKEQVKNSEARQKTGHVRVPVRLAVPASRACELVRTRTRQQSLAEQIRKWGDFHAPKLRPVKNQGAYSKLQCRPTQPKQMPKVDVELNQPVEVQTVWVLTRDLCRVSSCELDAVSKWNPFLSSELSPSREV